MRWSKDVVCDNCGEEFTIFHKERLNREHLFCCKKCEGEYRKKNNPNKTICPICGKEFYIKPSYLNKRKQPCCCSRECLGILRSIIYKGEDNPNYGNRGSNNPLWKSDKRISSYGYVLVKQQDHPFANVDGYVFEHRLVAEKELLTPETSIYIDGKAYLSPEYIVHHKDKDRQNNNVENLEIMTLSEHTRMQASNR